MASIRTLLAATAIAAVSAPAFAADVIDVIPEPPVAVEVPFSWTGAYVGGQIGYLNADIEIDVNDTVFDDQFSLIADADGFLGGVHAGVNFELAGFVVGAYADIDFTSADIDLGAIDPGVGDVNYVARAMAKVGAGLGRTLLYAQGGVAYIDADFDAGFTFSGEDESDDEFGYVVGAGVDFAVTDNVIIGADYLYHNFDGLGETNAIVGDADVTGVNSDTDVDAHTFRAKFAYKF